MPLKFLFTICCMLYLQAILAQWDGNAFTVNNPITNTIYADREALNVTDGNGGIISIWRVFDFANNVQNIYTQRKNVNGTLNWGTATNPILLFTSTHYVDISDIVADGLGGAYISWVDNLTDTTSNLHLQKINNAGTLLFSTNGIIVNSNNTHKLADGKLFADNSGAVITWADEIASTITDIPTYAQVFAQKYTINGQAQWGPNPIQVSTASGLRANPNIIGDGNNGVFIAFLDTRNSGLNAGGDFDNIDIYAQHISSTGNKLWPTTDAAISTEINNQYTIFSRQTSTTMIADSVGGFYIVYEDYKIGNDSNNHYYLQRLNTNGNRLLPNNGLALTGNTARSNRTNATLLYDGFNGVIASWDEHEYNINLGEAHAQRVSNAGNFLWNTPNITISPNAGNMYGAKAVCADGTGNYIFVWNTFNDSINATVIKAQKINNTGNKLWNNIGIPICYNNASNANNISIVKSNSNSIIVWDDDRNMNINSTDIYAAKLSFNGSLINSTYSAGYVTATNGTWLSPTTWVGGQIPPQGADVTILHQININTNVVCNSLQVIQPAALTVNSGFTVTVLH
jgi:hypothetical protein